MSTGRAGGGGGGGLTEEISQPVLASVSFPLVCHRGKYLLKDKFVEDLYQLSPAVGPISKRLFPSPLERKRTVDKSLGEPVGYNVVPPPSGSLALVILSIHPPSSGKAGRLSRSKSGALRVQRAGLKPFVPSAIQVKKNPRVRDVLEKNVSWPGRERRESLRGTD